MKLQIMKLHTRFSFIAKCVLYCSFENNIGSIHETTNDETSSTFATY